MQTIGNFEYGLLSDTVQSMGLLTSKITAITIAAITSIGNVSALVI